jgi:hypothetical protein
MTNTAKGNVFQREPVWQIQITKTTKWSGLDVNKTLTGRHRNGVIPKGRPRVSQSSTARTDTDAALIGTIGKSEVIDDLIRPAQAECEWSRRQIEVGNSRNCRSAIPGGTVTIPLPLVSSGYHTLNVWMMDPGIVLERIVVRHGPVRHSYLGPPESFQGSAVMA